MSIVNAKCNWWSWYRLGIIKTYEEMFDYFNGSPNILWRFSIGFNPNQTTDHAHAYVSVFDEFKNQIMLHVYDAHVPPSFIFISLYDFKESEQN